MPQVNAFFAQWFRTMSIIIPSWLLSWILTGLLLVLCFGVFNYALYRLLMLYGLDIFHAFETFKLKKKHWEAQSQGGTLYFEITVPKNSQTTAFQVQQKILKALHSVYQDPIKGPHKFSNKFYFFQKMLRSWKVGRSKQIFFTMQVWAQYPYISLRLQIPKAFFQRVEKAIFNAYPNAEITMLDKTEVLAEVAKYQKSFLSYGQSNIEGEFYHRIKTFKDLSSDPVDSIISTMEALSKGRFMAYNISLSPASHYYNQLIQKLIEQQQEYQKLLAKQEKTDVPKLDDMPDLSKSQTIAMAEKTKAPLFQIIISYWAISSTPEDAEMKLSNIQSILTEVNQKNMNTLEHKRLFTKQVEQLAATGQLTDIIDTKPVFKSNKHRFWPFGVYKNHGQMVSDIELQTLWHLPNTNEQTVSSVKMVKFKKKPATQQMQEYDENFYVDLGKSNFRMQEESAIGIPLGTT